MFPEKKNLYGIFLDQSFSDWALRVSSRRGIGVVAGAEGTVNLDDSLKQILDNFPMPDQLVWTSNSKSGLSYMRNNIPAFITPFALKPLLDCYRRSTGIGRHT